MGGRSSARLHRSALLLCLSGALLGGCATHHTAETPAAASSSVSGSPAQRPAPSPIAASFDLAVKPVLSRKCTPCHVPGGKMYERLPFDNPAIVLSNRDGILRRLKAPEDRQPVEAWIAAQPGSP